MMTRSIVWTLLVALPIGCTSPSYEPASVEDNGPDRETEPEARAIFETAVDALGGADSVAGVRSLVMEGTGEARNLGQNRTPEDENPVWEITEFRRDLDPEGRMRTREFEDHLTLFEVPSSEARSQAVITTARTLVPEKPLTEAIVSHHHFDHSAGLRVAVASGLTIIAHQSNAAFFEELVARPHTRDPDALEQFPAPMELIEVGDVLVLEDPAMRVELYHVLENPREGTNLFAWVPRDRILVQSDLYDSGWLSHPWADNFRENLERRGLDVALHVPVHGTIQTDNEVLGTLGSSGIN